MSNHTRKHKRAFIRLFTHMAYRCGVGIDGPVHVVGAPSERHGVALHQSAVATDGTKKNAPNIEGVEMETRGTVKPSRVMTSE